MAAVRELWQPPRDIDAERGLLGALLYDAKVWPMVAGKVAFGDFFRAGHAKLFDVIAGLAGRGQAVDALSVASALERSGDLAGIGGREYLAELVEVAPSGAAAAEAYAGIVRDRATLRRLYGAGERIMRMVRTDERSAEELLGDASKLLQDLAGGARSGKGLVAARRLVEELVEDLDRRKDGARGLSVGLPDFDSLTCGLEDGDLVIVAARPGLGKTALLVTIAAHVSKSTGVAVFSAEMPASQLMRRCVALIGGVKQSNLRQAQDLTDEDWNRIEDAAVAIATRRLWIDDTGGPTIQHIRAETLALAAHQPLGLVMVDYAQLVKGEGATRYDELRQVAYGLKELAKELRCPVVALAQLNRGVEQRDNKRPRLSDLRDSGAIEEAADIVAMLYSEGYYNPEFSMPYVVECAVEKNRNASRGLCYWHFAGEHSRMGALDPGARAQYRHHLNAMAKRRGADEVDL